MNNSFSGDNRSHSFSLVRRKNNQNANPIISTRYSSALINPEDMKIRLPSLDLLKAKGNSSVLIERNAKLKVNTL